MKRLTLRTVGVTLTTCLLLLFAGRIATIRYDADMRTTTSYRISVLSVSAWGFGIKHYTSLGTVDRYPDGSIGSSVTITGGYRRHLGLFALDVLTSTVKDKGR